MLHASGCDSYLHIEVHFILFSSRIVGLLESSICYYDLRRLICFCLPNKYNIHSSTSVLNTTCRACHILILSRIQVHSYSQRLWCAFFYYEVDCFFLERWTNPPVSCVSGCGVYPRALNKSTCGSGNELEGTSTVWGAVIDWRNYPDVNMLKSNYACRCIIWSSRMHACWFFVALLLN
jgi:hypothetical protein